jgi:hypothetical protein
MSRRFTAALLGFALALSGARGAAPAPEKKPATPEEVMKAQEAVQKYLEQIKGAQARVQHIKDDAVEKVLPGSIFFAVLYPQFPVGRVPPKGLSVSNVFFVTPEGKVEAVPGAERLLPLVRDRLSPVRSDAEARDVVRAYVRLVQEFSQDGFYKFVLMDEATAAKEEGGKRTATAKVVVMQGGNGEITASLTFDADGKLTGASVAGKLQPGPRPICQASRLLHPDPLVRRICEQDLLIMGEAAREYLMEQRALASPELQREIDRVWRRIQNGER